MKKIFLSAAMLCAIINTKAQTSTDSTGFKSRKLKLEEINFVSSYYRQNGNNAAVTGGIGTQKLTDIANMINVKLVKYDKKYRKNIFDAELGIDHYSSASSDMVDLKANSSASSADTRIYPSLNWSRENKKKGTTIGTGLSTSVEYDYQSYGANLSFSQKTKNKNGEFTAKVQAYLDQVSQIKPIELRDATNSDDNTASKPRNTFAASLSYSQIINQRLQVMFLADAVQQNGYLSLPFHRVYFADGTVHQENLPGNRFKIPLGIRANYFLGDRYIVNMYYRFYKDNWGLIANTAELEVPIKITPFFSVSPFYRYYSQTDAKYFAPYKQHTATQQFYTSNYDLSKFNSQFLGANFRITPPKGIFGIKQFSSMELRYGHYSRTNGLNSDIMSLHIKLK